MESLLSSLVKPTIFGDHDLRQQTMRMCAVPSRIRVQGRWGRSALWRHRALQNAGRRPRRHYGNCVRVQNSNWGIRLCAFDELELIDVWVQFGFFLMQRTIEPFVCKCLIAIFFALAPWRIFLCLIKIFTLILY